MERLLKNESFENKLSLLSLLRNSKDPTNNNALDCLRTIEEFGILKIFPDTIDYDLVQSTNMGISLMKKNLRSSQNVYNLSYFIQRLVNICSSIPNGKIILTDELGVLDLEKYDQSSDQLVSYISMKKQNILSLEYTNINDFLHTAFVAFYALNNLRDITDIFPAVFGVFSCSDIIGESNYCTHTDSKYRYMITEPIRGLTVSQFGKNSNLVTEIFVRVVGALHLAYKTYKYKHNSLTLDNIRIIKEQERDYYVGNNTYIKSEYYVTIIDMGTSSIGSISVPGVEKDDNSFSDVKKLLDIFKSLGNDYDSKISELHEIPPVLNENYVTEAINLLHNNEKTVISTRKVLLSPLPLILNKNVEAYKNPMKYLLNAAYVDKLNYSLGRGNSKILYPKFNERMSKFIFNDITEIYSSRSIPDLMKMRALFDAHKYMGSPNKDIEDYEKKQKSIEDNYVKGKMHKVDIKQLYTTILAGDYEAIPKNNPVKHIYSLGGSDDDILNLISEYILPDYTDYNKNLLLEFIFDYSGKKLRTSINIKLDEKGLPELLSKQESSLGSL